MLKYQLITALLYIFFGGLCLSFASVQGQDYYSDYVYADEYDNQMRSTNSNQRFSNRRERRMAETNSNRIVLTQPYREFRMGNWDYCQNWRHNRVAYLQGKTQSQYYREQYPHGPGRVGYDADDGYVRYVYAQARNRYNEANNRKQLASSSNKGQAASSLNKGQAATSNRGQLASSSNNQSSNRGSNVNRNDQNRGYYNSYYPEDGSAIAENRGDRRALYSHDDFIRSQQYNSNVGNSNYQSSGAYPGNYSR